MNTNNETLIFNEIKVIGFNLELKTAQGTQIIEGGLSKLLKGELTLINSETNTPVNPADLLEDININAMSSVLIPSSIGVESPLKSLVEPPVSSKEQDESSLKEILEAKENLEDKEKLDAKEKLEAKEVLEYKELLEDKEVFEDKKEELDTIVNALTEALDAFDPTSSESYVEKETPETEEELPLNSESIERVEPLKQSEQLPSKDKAPFDSEERSVTLSLDTQSDSGDKDDWVTNVQKPIFVGKSEGDIALINVEVNGKTYRASIDSDGNYTVNATEPLDDGNYTVKVTAITNYGNQTTTQATLTIDTEAPNTTVLVNGVNDVIDGSLSNDPTPALSGKTEPGARITLTVGNQEVATTAANEEGEWHVEVPEEYALEDGPHDIELNVYDVAGNSSQYITKIIVDTIVTVTGGLDVDSDTGSSHTDGITSDNTPSFSGTAEVGGVVTVTMTDSQGFSSHQEVAVDSDGIWALDWAAELADGDYIYVVSAVDLAGNILSLPEQVLAVDTVADVKGGLNVDSDTGLSHTDGITSDNTPSFSGMAEVGSVVKVTLTNSNGASAYQNVAVDSDGNWALDWATTLIDGDYSYVVSAVDVAGNEDTSSKEAQVLIIDTVADVNGGLNVESDTGSSDIDGITSDNTPSFSGTAEAGSVVTVTVTNSQGFSGHQEVAVDDNGNWALDWTTTLIDGNYHYVVSAVDVAGNEKSLSQKTLVIDTVGPANVSGGLNVGSDTGSSQTDGITSDNTPSFNGMAEAGSVVTVTVTEGQGVSTAQEVTVDDDGNWALNWAAELVDGDYTYVVSAVDAAGNQDTSSKEPQTLIIDTVADVNGGLDAGSDTGSSHTDGITSDNTPSFSGTAEVGSVVKVMVTDEQGASTHQEVAVDSNGNWALDWVTELTDGDYSYVVSAVDVAGNEKSLIQKTLVIDTVGPANVSGGLDAGSDTGLSHTDGVTADNTPRFSGTADAGGVVTVTVTDGQDVSTEQEVTVDDDGNWTLDWATALTDGNYSYVMSAVDVAGNQDTSSKESQSLVIDTVGPANVSGGLDAGSDTGSSDMDGITSNNTPTFSGMAEAGGVVTVTVTDGQGVSTDQKVVVDNNGDWALDWATMLIDGTYHYVVSAVDVAGNQDTSSKESQTLVIDTVGPANVSGGLDASSDTGSSNTDGITSDSTPRFSGTAEAGGVVTVTVTQDGQSLSGHQEVAVDSNGNWALDWATALDDGHYSYVVSAVDVAGNQDTSPTAPQTLVIDTVADVMGGLDAGSDTGSSDIDGITSNNTPSFSGTAEAGSIVMVTVADGQGASRHQEVAVDSNGDWALDWATTLIDGDYHYVVSAVDVAGNEKSFSQKTLVIDTVGPANVSGGLAAGSDTGSSNMDGITSNSTPSFSGTADAGGVVTVTVTDSDDHPSHQEVVVDNNGNWTLDWAMELTDGTYHYVVSAVDVAGNEDTSSKETQTLVIDTIGPANVSGGLDASSDTGSSDMDGITSNNTPKFSGTAEAGGVVTVTVTVTQDGQSLSTHQEVAVDSDGNWAFDWNTELADGHYNYVVSAEDVAGNETLLIQKTLVIDTVAPTNVSGGLDAGSDTGLSDTDGITFNNTPNFSGMAEAGSVVMVTVTDSDGHPTYKEVAVGSDSSWALDWEELTDGDYHYVVSAVDVAGNAISLPQKPLVIDTIAPINVSGGLDAGSDTGSSDMDGITSNDIPRFSGMAEADSVVTVTLTDSDGNPSHQAMAVDSNGDWAFDWTTTLIDGDYTYVVSAVDVAGNQTSLIQKSLVIDTVGPNVSGGLKTSSDTGSSDIDGITFDKTPNFGGMAEAGAVVTVTMTDSQSLSNHQEVTVDNHGNWALDWTTTLIDGTYHYVVSAVDVAGNQTSLSQKTLVIDTVGPTNVSGGLDNSSDTGSSNTDGITSDKTPNFSGTAEAGGVVTVTVTDGQGLSGYQEVTVDNNGNWSLDWTTALNDGHYTYVVSAVDVAGNEDTSTKETQTLVIDTVGPNVSGGLDAGSDTGSSNTDGITSDNTLRFSGMAEEEAVVTVTVTDSQGLSNHQEVAVDSNGDWALDWATTLIDGNYSYVVSAVDVAGNVTSLIQKILVIDTVTPASVDGGLDVESDTGSSHTDGITSENTPRFSGTAEAGDVVTVTVTDAGGHPTHQEVIVDSNGDWALDWWDTELADGDYTYVVSAVDVAGNEKSLTQKTLVIDTVGPTNLSGGLNASSDTGSSDTDGITSDKTSSFSGMAEVGSVVTVTVINGRSHISQEVAVDSNGDWALDWNTTLNDGHYSYVVSAVDVAGNETLLSNQVLTVDTVANVSGKLAYTGSSETSTNGNELAVDFTAEKDANITIEYTGPNGYSKTYTEVGTGTAMTFNIPDADKPTEDGDYSVTISSTDVAGNSNSFTDSIVLDTHISVDQSDILVDGDDNSDGVFATSNATSKVTYTNSSISEVTITLNGEVFTGVQSESIFTFYLEFSEGINSLVFTLSDDAGNTTTSTVEVSLQLNINHFDVYANGEDITGDSYITTNDGTLELRGNTEYGVDVKIINNGVEIGSTTADQNGSWTYDMTLLEGNNLIAVIGEDAAGNIKTTNVTVDYDVYPPILVIDNVESAHIVETNDDEYRITDNVTITGRSENSAVITITINGVSSGEISSTGGRWSTVIDKSLLTDGNNTVIITATDVAGNLSAASDGTITLTKVNNIMPATYGSMDANSDTDPSHTDGATSDNTPSFSGKARAMDVAGNENSLPDTVVDASLARSSDTATYDTTSTFSNYADIGSQEVTGKSKVSDIMTKSSSVDNKEFDNKVVESTEIDAEEEAIFKPWTFDGHSSPNTIVSLEVENTRLETMSNEEGEWSIIYNAEQAGTYDYTVNYIDSNSQESTSSQGVFTVENVVLEDLESDEMESLHEMTAANSPSYSYSQDYMSSHDFMKEATHENEHDVNSLF